jgi:hypothetical protein
MNNLLAPLILSVGVSAAIAQDVARTFTLDTQLPYQAERSNAVT